MAARRKPKPTKPTTPVYAFDDGARGAANVARASVIDTIGGGIRGAGNTPTAKVEARRYEVECRLDLLLARGLPHRLWQAGILFRRSWRTVQQSASVISSYGARVGGSGSHSMQELEYWQQARARLDKAYAVLKPAERDLVIAVCGEDEAVGDQGGRLRSGLEKLAELWRIGRVGEGLR